MNADEALLFFFLIEHIGFGAVAFGLYLARWHNGRKARQEETSATLHAAQAQNQIADIRDEMTQMREMMADMLLDRHDRQSEVVTAESGSEDALPGR